MAPKLIVFDCDGVLVDSEILVVEVEAALLSEAGFPLTADQVIRRYVGLSYDRMMDAVASDFGRAVPPDLQHRIEAAALDRLAREVRPVAGMGRLVGRLAALGQPRCVASASEPERIAMSLRVAGLDQHFEPGELFSTRMVERPKPAPDVFLLAAAQMGVEPTECVVIEDSPHGVASAQAAGMTPIGLTAGGHATADLADRLRAAGAVEVFSSAADLGLHLDQLRATP